MITVLSGKDDFSAREALDELRATLDTDGQLADNTVVVDGPAAKPADLLAVCQTIPFLGSRRLVIVRGLLSRFEAARGARGRRRSAPEAGDWKDLFIDRLGELPETTALVFIDGDIGERNAFLTALRGRKDKDLVVRSFPALPQGELAAWITRRAAKLGVDLEARATATLSQLVGPNLWVLEGEMRKLAALAHGRAVTEADVREAVSLARDPSVFAMADAAVEGRHRDAAELMQRLLADGMAPQQLLAMLARQYRLLILTCDMVARRLRPAEVQTRLAVHNFVAQRLLKQAPAYNVDTLRRAYRRILEADLAIKRGVFDDETALYTLLAELAALARPRRAAV